MLLSEILSIVNLRHAASMIWTRVVPEFRHCWLKLCSSGSHYITVLQLYWLLCIWLLHVDNFFLHHVSTQKWLKRLLSIQLCYFTEVIVEAGCISFSSILCIKVDFNIIRHDSVALSIRKLNMIITKFFIDWFQHILCNKHQFC